MIRAMIVEDVPLARSALRRLLDLQPDVTVVAEAATATEALRLAAGARLNMAFLDIALPDGSGLDLAARLPSPRPALVFLTAYAEHALAAFEVEALDYLLKPVGAEELARALGRVRRALGREAPSTRPDAVHLPIRDGTRTLLVPIADIDHVDSAGHYLCVHVDAQVHLMRGKLGELEERLGAGFVRVHRTALVRVARIRAVVDRQNRDADLHLSTGAIIPLSRTYRAGLEEALARFRA